MTKGELEQYRLGARSALSPNAGGPGGRRGQGEGHAWLPEKAQAALAELFGGEAKFGRLMETLGR
jgi:hypothetical protein